MEVAVVNSQVTSPLPHPYLGAWQTDIADLLGHLSAAGHGVSFFTGVSSERSPPRKFSSLEKAGVLVWEVPYEESLRTNVLDRCLDEGTSFVNSLAAHPAFAPAIFDILYVHHWTSAAGLAQFIPAGKPLALAPFPIPSELAVSLDCRLPERVRQQEDKILTSSTLVMTQSPHEKQSIDLRFPSVPTTLIAAGLDQSLFDCKIETSDQERFRFVSIGLPSHESGYELLLDAFEAFLRMGGEGHLEIASISHAEDAALGLVQERLDRTRLRERVTLSGLLDHVGIAELLSGCDVYLQLCGHERGASPLMKAMAAGRVVVSTNSSVIGELRAGTTNGILIDSPISVAGVAKGMLESCRRCQDLTLRTEARNTAREHASGASIEATTKSLEGMVSLPGAENPAQTSQWRHEQIAQESAYHLAKMAGVQAVFGIGSLARGDSREGSDIDLLVLEDDADQSVLRQRWDPTSDPPVDIRFVDASVIQHLASCSDEEFIEACVSGHLPEILKHTKRYAGPDYAGRLQEIRARRLQPDMLTSLQVRWASEAVRHLDCADSHIAASALADSRLALHQAANCLLHSILMPTGWHLQGAKRRPEQLAKYLQSYAPLQMQGRDILRTIGCLSPNQSMVRDLVTTRQRLRAAYVDVLRSLEAGESVLEQAERHGSSNSYYVQLLSAGYWRGVVYHSRVFSGLRFIPTELRQTCGSTSEHPATMMIESSQIDPAFVRDWSFICLHDLDVAELRRDSNILRGTTSRLMMTQPR